MAPARLVRRWSVVTVDGSGSRDSPWNARPLESWRQALGVPRLELHRRLVSTNERLRVLARDGAPPFTTVVAEEQTRGVGRGGAEWYSPEGGGLWISVLLPFPSRGAPGVLPIAVGVASARAVERITRVSVDLKWPNDLLVESRKVGGVLCQASGGPTDSVVAGLGLNLRPGRGGSAALPPGLTTAIGYLETSSGRPVSEPEVAVALLDELRRWSDPSDPEVGGALRSEWDTRDCLRGRPVQVEGGLRGVARGLAPDGALQIVGDDAITVSVRAGSVRLQEPGPSPALYRRPISVASQGHSDRDE